jgi:hypothetical protein
MKSGSALERMERMEMGLQLSIAAQKATAADDGLHVADEHRAAFLERAPRSGARRPPDGRGLAADSHPPTHATSRVSWAHRSVRWLKR